MDFKLLRGAVHCVFRKGDIIMQAGQSVDYIYYLVSGSVCRNIMSQSGGETTIWIMHGKDDNNVENLLGILSLYTANRTVGYSTFVAKTVCRCYRIPSEVVEELVNNDPVLLRQMLVYSLRVERIMLNMYHCKRDHSSIAQLASLLMEHSKEDVTGEKRICQLSNTDLALILGVHTVTVSRILSQLKKNGIIHRMEHGWRIDDMDRLLKIANGTEKISYRYDQ